mgnify:CR=1 FL=1
MWSIAYKQLSFTGTVRVSVGMGEHLPLKGVMVDVYRFEDVGHGEIQFERLNQVPARTDMQGVFGFSDLSVPVKVQMVVPHTPPHTPVELTNPESLPNLAFRFSIEAEVLKGGVPQGTEFADVYDERKDVNGGWLVGHPERKNVPLVGSCPILVLIPEGDAEATFLAGSNLPDSTVTGKQFHFLRVGRVIRDEIGELGDNRPDYKGKPGYMISSDIRTVEAEPSFFGGQIDAPFGGTLQIGGCFGNEFLKPPLSDNLYYTVSFSEYTGDQTKLFDPNHLTNERPITDPLSNHKYILPTADLPNGKWETLNLGPFEGTITNVKSPGESKKVQVYKRPNPRNDATEYWPFWDLMVTWNSAAAPNKLVVLTLEAYEKTGGTEIQPELRKLTMVSPQNALHILPLQIDNSPPIPEIFDIRTGFATFSPEQISGPTSLDECGLVSVKRGDQNGNEYILVTYSIKNSSGDAHLHLYDYNLRVRYSPKGSLGSANVLLKQSFNNKNDISGSYPAYPQPSPTFSVENFESVLVPANPDGWPPEPNGACEQYGAAVELNCLVRTVDGWGRLFGRTETSQYIIIKLG